MPGRPTTWPAASSPRRRTCAAPSRGWSVAPHPFSDTRAGRDAPDSRACAVLVTVGNGGEGGTESSVRAIPLHRARGRGWRTPAGGSTRPCPGGCCCPGVGARVIAGLLLYATRRCDIAPGAGGAYPPRMRGVFRGDLAQLGAELATMCGQAGDAMDSATRALLRSNLLVAEQVISAGTELAAARARCEERTFGLLLLQAPVARDLRLVVTGIQAAEKIERMGGLARHVAEIARRRHPDCAVPAELVDQFAEMGRLAVLAARRVQQIIAAPVEEHFAELDRADDRIDELHREVLAAVQRPDSRSSVRDGVDVALLARYFERFADQAVSVTRRVDYIVTGSVPGRSA
jgi:phosphate transport system protein